MHWHFLVTRPADGVFNMALDEGLMTLAARCGIAVFRVYGWSTPTLSLGRNQRARGQYNLGAAAAGDVSVVRRPTGGRALLHHREITYSVAMPVGDAAGARQAYGFINEVLVRALRQMGVAATHATETAALPPGPRPCFDVPSEHEIVLGSRKLVGSAQWRHGGAVLQHGSILVRDDQQRIATLMHDPPAMPPVAATLADALGREPSLDETGEALHAAIAASTGRTPATFTIDAVLRDEVDRLSRTYRDDAWTWRR